MKSASDTESPAPPPKKESFTADEVEKGFVPRSTLASRRAYLASRLVMCEHELGDQRNRLGMLEQELDELRGSLKTLDLLLKPASTQ